MTELTPEEKAQFTPVNSAAFDLARMMANLAGERIPCWLCTEESVREKYRQDIFEEICRKLGRCIPDAAVERLIDDQYAKGHDLLLMLTIWEQAELESKEAREAGNAEAFFVPAEQKNEA